MKTPSLLFYSSIFIGITVWFFFFFTTPIEIKTPLSTKSIAFIFLCYSFLVYGFFVSNKPFQLFSTQILSKTINSNKTNSLKVLIVLITISFFFRYYDLLVNRNLSFLKTTALNRINAGNQDSFSLGFSLLSMFRVLYFLPIIFFLSLRIRSKKLLYFSILLFVLPLFEGYLRGSRRIIFESVLFLVIILSIFKKTLFFSLKRIGLIFLFSTILLVFSFYEVKSRVKDSHKDFYTEIFNVEYNDFVPPKPSLVHYIKNNEDNILSNFYFSQIHIGQYIVHGVYEMDYMIKSKPKLYFGKYNFYLVVKLFNKLGVTNENLKSLHNPTKRITYITFFGGLYLDFKWFSLVFMFMFGWIQKQLILRFNTNVLVRPFIIIFIFFNMFMLVVNFLRASLLFPLLVYAFLLLLVNLILRVNKPVS